MFEDALGTRHHADAGGGEPLEVLELRGEFGSEAFESALRGRVTLLESFHSTWFTQVRTVQRVNQNGAKLFVVYDRVAGARLSAVIGNVSQPLNIQATICLVRQLVAAIALLHEKLPNISHGAIAPERILITPKARLVVSDHVLGAALEQLRFSPDQYWDQLRVPLPNDLEPTFDQRADVMQIGVLALELILGRQLARDEYPVRIHELTERAWEASAATDARPLPAELRTWLLRMLQLDTERPFATAVEAWENLEQVLLGSDNRASFVALESVIAEHMRKAAATPAATPAPVKRPSGASLKPASGPHAAAASEAHPKPQISDPPKPEVVAPVASEPSPAPVSVMEPAVKESAPAPVVRTLFATEVTTPSPSTESVPSPTFSEREAAPVQSSSGSSRRWLAAAAVLLFIGSGAALFGRRYLMPSAAAEAPGTLVVTTNPAGVPVVVDGQARGVTPLTVELAPGTHELKLEAEGGPRVIPFTVTAGSVVSQTLELPRVAPTTGQLSIRSEPPGARVSVDGTPRGTTPLVVDGLAPGAHRIALESDVSSVTQEVTVEAGATASLVVPMTTPQGVPLSGWVQVQAPAEVFVFEQGRLVGNSQSDQIMVTAGRHEFDVMNESLGYHSRHVVTVAPGKVSQLRLQWPNGTLALNAQPWADVYINGQRIGETPIGEVTLPLGTHEVTFRHPELGDQVVKATVTATNPTRVSVDMRKR
jgi:serine/threonine protein kinase